MLPFIKVFSISTHFIYTSSPSPISVACAKIILPSPIYFPLLSSPTMCRPPPTPHLFVTIPPPLLAPSYLHLHTHLNKYIIIHKTLERTYTVYLLIILFKVNCTCVHRVHILTFLLYGPRFEFPASMLMLQYYHAAILFAEYSPILSGHHGIRPRQESNYTASFI